MSLLSRRSFLTSSSLALAGARIDGRRSAHSLRLPPRAHDPVSAFFPDLVDPNLLRTVALAGVDAARQAGADYADIRVADARTMSWTQIHPAFPPSGWLNFTVAYGIRVRVGGAWGFAFGTEVTVDEVARAAQSAIRTTRGVSKFAPSAPGR
jgi:hypothetical protein